MCRRTIFKVYGKFDWPGSGAGDAEQVCGKFLFYYAEVEGLEGENHACVEWVPDTKGDRHNEQDRPKKNIGDISPSELAALRKGEPFNYFLRGKLGDGKGFTITGAQVLEQIAQENTALSLRLLLAARFEYGGAGKKA